MFYSHTFLARKGPLGTVWCAAHLQHRLKKSHYTSTDISSTVERIIYPEVPIALRMSGHLLLGVVRIYSKKVDYLYQDCNVVLISINKFSSVQVNLPEDATHAPFHSVTLPEKFELDSLDIDDYLYEGFHDNHTTNLEDITLTDQIPTGRDPYVIITLDENIRRDPSPVGDTAGLEASAMEVVGVPPLETAPDRFEDTDRVDQSGTSGMNSEEQIPQEVPEIEVLRDAVPNAHLENVPEWVDQGREDILEPDTVLEQQIMNEKNVTSPALEEIFDLAGRDLPSPDEQELPSASTNQTPNLFDAHMNLEHSPELELRPSPPDAQPDARPQKRRRLARGHKKLHFDEHTVLTNKFMKKALDDTSDLLRKRKDRPSSALGIWKSNKRLKKENIFSGSLITGLCTSLSDLCREDYIAGRKPQLTSTEEAQPHLTSTEEAQTHLTSTEAQLHLTSTEEAQPHLTSTGEAQPHLTSSEEAHSEHGAKSPISEPDLDREIERLRDYEGPSATSLLPEVMASPFSSIASPSRQHAPTPAFSSNFGSHSEIAGTSVETEVLPTPDLGISTGPLDSELDTPTTFLEERLGDQHATLFDIPEMNSEGELNFLEEDDNLTGGSRGTPDVDYSLRRHKGTPEIGALSARTRAVAQYLKRHSSVTPTQEGPSDLTLNKMLEGKSKKVCARMFFETLVLKNYGLVDVQQEEPYHDVKLKVTPRLLKGQF